MGDPVTGAKVRVKVIWMPSVRFARTLLEANNQSEVGALMPALKVTGVHLSGHTPGILATGAVRQLPVGAVAWSAACS